MCIESAGRG
jgi:hypothetical protein